MKPFYTDYNGDYPDDSPIESVPVEEPSCSADAEALTGIVECAGDVVYKICDELGLLPGARWIDGGPQ